MGIFQLFYFKQQNNPQLNACGRVSSSLVCLLPCCSTSQHNRACTSETDTNVLAIRIPTLFQAICKDNSVKFKSSTLILISKSYLAVSRSLTYTRLTFFLYFFSAFFAETQSFKIIWFGGRKAEVSSHTDFFLLSMNSLQITYRQMKFASGRKFFLLLICNLLICN